MQKGRVLEDRLKSKEYLCEYSDGQNHISNYGLVRADLFIYSFLLFTGTKTETTL